MGRGTSTESWRISDKIFKDIGKFGIRLNSIRCKAFWLFRILAAVLRIPIPQIFSLTIRLKKGYTEKVSNANDTELIDARL